MNEHAALELLAERLQGAGDDAAIIGDQALTIDMLHDTTDFPDGITDYTVGWRAIGASLSDIAAMGADAQAAVAAYGAPQFDRETLLSVIDGAIDVCQSVGAEYVGGDLDCHPEQTVVSAGLGTAENPVYRSGASPDERICVTGTVGRTAAAMQLFESGATDRANDLFRFSPRVAAGTTLAEYATAMIDASDGVARSLHLLASASECGMDIDPAALPINGALTETVAKQDEQLDAALFFGEDFELVCTIPADQFDAAQAACPVALTDIGVVTETGVTINGQPLADEGYEH